MPFQEQRVQVPAHTVRLEGDLAIPPRAHGLVLFAHGSGSSRHSPRNRFVAGVLQRAGLATLLIDLLTRSEEAIDNVTAELRFDIDLFAERLVDVADWLTTQPATQTLRIGTFGASTGAAAALIAAANRPSCIGAVVSRGGRPDLADAHLGRVQSPVLLIVGGGDMAVLDLNRQAQARLHCVNELKIIPGATHLFQEPGALEQVAELAGEWFLKHLQSQTA